jgi:cell division protein FtsQ
MFRRPTKNRRLAREQVLDVKLRSSLVRAARFRLAGIVLGGACAVVLGGYSVWHGGKWTLNRLVYKNEAFSIRQLEVETDGVIPVEQLRRWAGVQPGDNLLALDLSRVKRNLELVPTIQSVSVERVLPHRLRIRVVEREPIARVNVPRLRPGGGFEFIPFQLDTEGYVILPMNPYAQRTMTNPPADSLALILGLPANDLQPGKRLESAQLRAALDLLLAFDESPMGGLADVRSIDLSAPDVLRLTTGQSIELTFGLRDLDQQLRRCRAIFDAAQRAGKSIAALDLAVTNHTPARWLEGTAPVPPPTAPKPHRPLHPRKAAGPGRFAASGEWRVTYDAGIAALDPSPVTRHPSPVTPSPPLARRHSSPPYV